MTVSVRGHSSIDSVTGGGITALTCPLPAGSAVGELCLALAVWNSAVTITATSTGYTAETAVTHSTTFTGRAFKKVLDAGDISAGNFIVGGSSGGRCSTALVVLQDAGTLEGPVTAAQSANDTTQPIPAIAPAAESVKVALVGYNINAVGTGIGATAPASWTELRDEVTQAGSGRNVGAWIGVHTAIDASPTTATDLTTDQASHSATWVYAVNSAVVLSGYALTIWNGTTEDPAALTIWNGTTEEPAVAEVAP